MTEMETMIAEQLAVLIPNYEKLEVRATISDTACSMEFFATVNGQTRQCYDMVDAGLMNEDDLDAAIKAIASQVRTSPEYKAGELNRIAFVKEHP